MKRQLDAVLAKFNREPKRLCKNQALCLITSYTYVLAHLPIPHHQF